MVFFCVSLREDELSKAFPIVASQTAMSLKPVIDLLGENFRILVSIIACGIATTEDMGEVQGTITHRHFLGKAFSSSGLKGSYRCDVALGREGMPLHIQIGRGQNFAKSIAMIKVSGVLDLGYKLLTNNLLSEVMVSIMAEYLLM